MLISDLLKRQKNNTRLAIKHMSKEIDYREWYYRSYSISKIISLQIGITSSNVAIFLPNSIDYAVAYFSVLMSNNIIFPLFIQSKEAEIVRDIEYGEIDLIITSIKYADFLKNSLGKSAQNVALLLIETQSIITTRNNMPFVPRPNTIKKANTDEDIAIMLHTSGTTSNPKRVMLSHRNLLSNIESNIMSLHLSSKDKTLIALPMCFGYCNTAQFLSHVYLGATLVIFDGMFVPRLFFQTVQQERITNFTGVPSMLLMLLNVFNGGDYDLSSLRFICFGGGNMPTKKLERLICTYKNIGFIQTYGQTEASPRISALLKEDSLKKIGSVGLPIPNVNVRIVSEFEKDVGPGEIGEIIVNGKNVMIGYYKQDSLTAKTIKNGWLYTGDLGYRDEDGYIYLTGRKKNIIICGGLNIYPEEIEEVLLEHPNIIDACVISEEHSILGEVPVAKIKTKNQESANDYRSYCRKRLSDYKIPIRFEIVDRIEKTYNEKNKRWQEK